MIPSRFVKSAVKPDEFPPEERPEVALVGRSNAGKSSLLNSLTGIKGLAKVSSTPGKTRLINFFEVGKYYSLVDLPGYGFASGNKDEVKTWGEMVEGYLLKRGTLKGILLLCDIRRKWLEEEQMIYDFAQQRDLDLVCVLTKVDKLSQNERSKQLKVWEKSSGLPRENFKLVSSLKGEGILELEKFIFDAWIRPAIA